MNELENIKKIVLEEMGQLSYLEKKRLNEPIDFQFIEKEKTKIEKHTKSAKVAVVIWILFSVAYIAFILLFNSSSQKIKYGIIFGFLYLIQSFGYFYQLGELKRKKSLYKILSSFEVRKN